MTFALDSARSVPRSADVVGVPVGTTGPVGRQVGLSRAALTAHGFEGKVGQTLVLPKAEGPTVIAVGIGDPKKVGVHEVRDAAAALARASAKRSHVATSLADAATSDGRGAAQAVVEGFVLASYRYTALKTKNNHSVPALTLVAPAERARSVNSGIERGRVTATAATLARDLANTPPAHLTARMLADRAVQVAQASGLDVEVFDRDKLEAMGCGGLLGVNRGSTEPPRMVKLTYTPRDARNHLVMVGKGVTYDSGGISLKPSDAMHANMKMDMTGAASVLSA
ncbi:MAG: leucyl aminopeptidase family protein, partial [Ilumatobacteraceae bacterium]